MSDVRLTETDDAGEPDRDNPDPRPGPLDFVYKVPFGMQAALLAGVIVAGTGVAGVITTLGGFGSTCCPPVIE